MSHPESPNAPILLLIFNRPELTACVFAAIREARPSKLFIAADGPRKGVPTDAALCAATRKVVEQIDWPCTVEKLYREENLGLKPAVEGALDWFFEHVEAGIILEDDCVPSPSFFPFCTELLERYATNEKVMMVSGCNIAGNWRTGHSYFFSLYAPIWGWASWRRAWKKYDGTLSTWPREKRRLASLLPDPYARKIKNWTYDAVYKGEKKSWAYAFEYAQVMSGGYSVIPAHNLVENIGFGAEATHTTGSGKGLRLPSAEIHFPLVHPETVESNQAYDVFFIEKAFRRGTVLARLARRLRRLFAEGEGWREKRELARLRHLPRFRSASTWLMGGMQLVDGASFVSAYEEIVRGRIYAFPTATKTPYVIDCGANVGVSVVAFKKQHPGAEILAFEPDPNVGKVLTHNVALHRLENVTLLQKAVWNADTQLSFFSEGADGGRVESKGENRIEAVRLKSFLNRPVDMLKIDIEGAEDTVLRDCESELSQVKNLFIEYHSRADKPQALGEILEILTGAGFRYHVQSVGIRSPQPFEHVRVSNLRFDNQANIFAYRDL